MIVIVIALAVQIAAVSYLIFGGSSAHDRTSRLPLHSRYDGRVYRASR